MKTGRISVAGITEGNVGYLANAIHEVTKGESIWYWMKKFFSNLLILIFYYYPFSMILYLILLKIKFNNKKIILKIL